MPEEFTAFPLRKDYPLQGRRRAAQFPGDYAGGELNAVSPANRLTSSSHL